MTALIASIYEPLHAKWELKVYADDGGLTEIALLRSLEQTYPVLIRNIYVETFAHSSFQNGTVC